MRNSTHIHRKRIYHGVSGPHQPVPDGYARCDCTKVLKIINVAGRFGRHKDPASGDLCVGSGMVVRKGLLDSTIREAAVDLGPAPLPEPGTAVPGKSRLEAGTLCVRCGKWLPGERSLCGRCQRARGRAR